jgi:4-oxalocrotonate tautomerase
LPVISVKLGEHEFTPVEKQQILQHLSDAVAVAKGDTVRPVTWVLMEEVTGGNCGAGHPQIAYNASSVESNKLNALLGGEK